MPVVPGKSRTVLSSSCPLRIHYVRLVLCIFFSCVSRRTFCIPGSVLPLSYRFSLLTSTGTTFYLTVVPPGSILRTAYDLYFDRPEHNLFPVLYVMNFHVTAPAEERIFARNGVSSRQ